MAELQYTPLIGDANLKAYYRFNAANMLEDSSGNGATLTNSNSVVNSDAIFEKGADFGTPNTTKKLYTTSNIPQLSNTNSSWFCWIKIGAEISTGRYIVFIYHSGLSNGFYQNIWYEYNSGTRRLNFEVGKEGIGPFANYQYNINLGTSNWYHIGYTFNGSAVTAYLNGSALGTTSNGSGTGNASTPLSLTIGWDNSNSANCNFMGIIDDFCFFNKILSASEISILYNDLSATANQLKQYRRTRVPGAITG